MKQKIHGVPLESGETVIDKVHAFADGQMNNGDLYLTSHRLVWVAHRVRPPLTLLFGERQILMNLGDVSKCYASGFSLEVEAKGMSHHFNLYRWLFMPLLWWRLTRRWAAAINEAKGRLGEAAAQADAPLPEQRERA